MSKQRRFRGPSDTPVDSDRMWPLDLSLIALSGLVLYLVVTRLSWDDPRWLFNAWTYAIAVPLTALFLAAVLHVVASRFVRKSVQVGFLFSVLVHLLLLILAINMVIFAAYMPVAEKGEEARRSPIRHTVPEHVFQNPQETPQRPDWSRPVETETTSRVEPQEQQQLPPVERTQPRLEMPRPRQQPRPELKKFLIERQQPVESKPMPADSPGKLARRQRQQETPQPSPTPIETPQTRTTQATRPDVMKTERQLTELQPRQSTSRRAPEMRNLMSLAPEQQRPQQRTPRAALRNEMRELPTVGDAGMARQQRQPARASRMQPAGAAPAPPTVAVAQSDPSASSMLSPVQVPVTRSGRTTGAQITAGETPSPATQVSPNSSVGGAELARSRIAARAGLPNVRGGDSPRAPGRASEANAAMGFAPVGLPNPAEAMAAAPGGTQGTGFSDEVQDRMGTSDFLTERSSTQGGANSSDLSNAGAPSLALNMIAPDGPVGFADRAATTPGVLPLDQQPEVASLDFNAGARPRRDVGGPVAPAGTKIAAVEAFSRRVKRTSGNPASAPAGMAGPETNEAIERGLAYLASIQNDDGSWSLQGHGENVVLRSDSAATGLCLLAFQGAGYTHRQTNLQYATTVERGLQFLRDNQGNDGDLYRPENEISNRNVALYSHGIAALALNEAYGMTQDPEYKEPAQRSLNFIAATQHRKLGGWRYTPQISADTSVSGWMMMALKSGELSGLRVPNRTYEGIDRWLAVAQSPDRPDRYRYNPFAPDTELQRHGRVPTPTITAVGMLMRMYSGWRREKPEMQSAADYLLEHPPALGTRRSPQRDAYYWYYATQVMFHMGGKHWEQWNAHLNPLLLQSQLKTGPKSGSWDPELPVRDRWSPHAGRLYVTTMNLLNLEVYYRHLPIYEETAE